MASCQALHGSCREFGCGSNNRGCNGVANCNLCCLTQWVQRLPETSVFSDYFNFPHFSCKIGNIGNVWMWADASTMSIAIAARDGTDLTLFPRFAATTVQQLRWLFFILQWEWKLLPRLPVLLLRWWSQGQRRRRNRWWFLWFQPTHFGV